MMSTDEVRELFAYDDWANGRLVEALAEPAPYRDPGGAEHLPRLGDQMRHVVNHSTYHRGQAATQLRQIGEVPPGTDLILYLRERG